MRHAPRRHAAGLSLPELMVALAVGMMLVLASISLLLAVRSAYLLHDDRARMEESGRFALELISRAVRQAGYRDWSAAGSGAAVLHPVTGLDARSLKDAADGIDGPYGSTVNGSDVLALRFDGSGQGGGDGAIQNCAGAAVGADSGQSGWSIFYIANDAGGEPELRCKYRGPNGWKSDALVRGIEGFQVLYGIEAQPGGASGRFVSATGVQAKAGAWQAVGAVRIALLARGAQLDAAGAGSYALFGPAYDGSADPGSVIHVSQLPAASRGLPRRIYGATIYLRNRGQEAP
jgi:type IV pilus assembly protein PilW